MSWKSIGQRDVADSKLLEHKALKELDDVDNLIDWGVLEAHLSDIHAKKRGELAWPPLMMLKALLLQSWYDLSDPQLEKQLARDLLFRKFVGLGMSDSVPDHSTIWRFRNHLSKKELLGTLFEQVNTQLTEQSLYIKEGSVSIIDASVIEAKQCRPNKNEAGESTQDPEAGWNVKKGSDGKSKATYGFKAHANVDEDGFVQNTAFSAGNEHDSNYLTPLLTGNESAAYADSAYPSKAHEAHLQEHEIENRMIRRAYRNRPLSDEDKKFNRMHSGVRSTVERVFGIFKQHYGMAKARYAGIQRNYARFQLMCMAYNMKRGVAIMREMCA